ncbi:hypothetical protein [Evansella cellulosilytica]|uniref:J domain-containing protein n=1 Tax=Evansella cellulosilytica (strain ATCC 21833 / DSM 2522 / FERM P-1141 / JCM 9156 / N-4) TaxID=649639 RepID=E6U1H5_EVAC2|nr:hypothetical protein [Evansella cellulosilytica]ADU30338.1 hypothetical protein Bcell_2077 [Evansella cellulosilytica DSM 2522]
MYCVIQKIKNKKPNDYGAPKELMVDNLTYSFDGLTVTKWGYKFSQEKFERPVLDAYKISIHKSYRKNGKVKKKQWSICTMSYYDLLEYSLYDCMPFSIKDKAEDMGISEDDIYDMVYEKLDPIVEQVTKEFEQTEEYKTKKRHEEILQKYRGIKKEFEQKYGADSYDLCYDIFGVLRDKNTLDALEMQYINREYEKKKSEQSSYYDNFNSNYKHNTSGYFNFSTSSNYTLEEKKKLKKIFRLASKNFHPDVVGDSGEMQKFLNKLKEDWGI